MILTIDVGNTQIELGFFKDDRLINSWRIATGIERTEDEFMMFIRNFLEMEGYSHKNLEAVAISSVVPTVTKRLQKMTRKYLQIDPLVVDHTLNLGGMKILYSDAAAVGADRLCSAVAAYHQFKQAVIIIDLGTATTFDVVNGRGEYLGGVISPGLETTAWALYHRAAKLPKISLEFPQTAIGRSTEESMQVGIMLGAVKMIDGLVAEITAELKEKPRVISTGGLSPLIQPKSASIELFQEHLVLEGLYKIYQFNK
ncbi:MAG: type III pantothenate kinase [Calditrichia bacterium]